MPDRKALNPHGFKAFCHIDEGMVAVSYIFHREIGKSQENGSAQKHAQSRLSFLCFLYCFLRPPQPFAHRGAFRSYRCRNAAAFRPQTFSTIRPSAAASIGYCPRSTSSPSLWQRMWRKYSWRGNELNERESVSIPTDLASSPFSISSSIWRRMPRMVSLNHHAAPNWTLGAKFTAIVASIALSAGFRP